MFQNHFKIALRTLFKNKGYSLINIGGLTTGMAVAMLIGLWMWDELSGDRAHENYDSIARVMQHRTIGGEVQTWWSTMYPLADELRENYGNHFERMARASFFRTRNFAIGDEKHEFRGMFMEPEGPEMFTLEMVDGTWHDLVGSSAIFISEKMAESFFGDNDPMGQVLEMRGEHPAQVAGVFKDFPENSSFDGCNYIASWELFLKSSTWIKKMQNPWGSNSFQLFVQLAPGETFENVSAKIKDVVLENVKGVDESAYVTRPEAFLFPMKNWQLYTDFENGAIVGGRIQYVWLFGIIGVFVLLLACINFMNLSTARSEKRAKEVGIRKTIGSGRGQLIAQFYGESMLVSIIAFAFALALVQFSLPWFNEVSDKEINLLWPSPWLWAAGLGFTLLTGILAGSYPAIFLSSFRPARVLKGTFKTGSQAALPRKVLVVVQFTVSVALVAGSLIVYQQIKHAQNRPIGYDHDRLVMFSIHDGDIIPPFAAMEAELKKERVVTELAFATNPVTRVWGTNGGLKWEGMDPNLGVDFPSTGISQGYGKTIGWEMAEGRDFDPNLASDSMGLVINEAFAKFMGVDKVVGTEIQWGDDEIYTILGVVKNIVVESPFQPIRPHFYYLTDNRGWILTARVEPHQGMNEAVTAIASVLEKHVEGVRHEVQFVDENYAAKFNREKRVGTLASFFTILAIFISCLGLFGLASYVAEQRTKEIGIRKILGASVLSIWQMLSKEFVVLVVVSCLVAVPLAYYFGQNWLQNFTYRMDIPWWVFAFSGLCLLFVALATVSFQAIKAALANPVESLRNE